MNQLTNDLLGFLFTKRYMDFKTCSGLRFVSAQLNFHASKYFRSRREFDLSILEENFDCDSEIVETPYYACLLETVTKYCDNLEKIVGIRVTSDTLVSVSRICLQKLPSLTNIGIVDDAVDASVHFSLLKLLPNLRSVTFLDINGDRDKDDDEVSEAEKLFVSELSLYCGYFWRIFRVDHLRKVSILICVYESAEDINKFCGALERCQRLEQLELEVFVGNSAVFPPLLRVAESLPHLKQFNLNLCLCTSSTEDVARIAHQLGQHTKKARIILAEPAGDCRIYQFFKKIKCQSIGFRCSSIV